MANFKFIFPIWMMGFISGMTLLITGNTMNFWLTQEQIDIKSIGMFALITLPYAINFLWSPLLDHIKLPILSKIFGMRFSWIIFLQLLLSISVFAISHLSPKNDLGLFAIMGLVISFLSSTQDVALGALRSKIIPEGKQGIFSGIYIFGYRIGMLIGSSGAIYLSSFVTWDKIYKIFAMIILYFPIILYIQARRYLEEDYNIQEKSSEITQYISLNFWLRALKQVGTIGVIISLLTYLILYRLPDNFISMMINPFLVGIGFNALQISTIGKFLGIITAIIGGLIASWIMNKLPIIDALLYFGIIHALSHLLFIFQNHMGDNIYSLFLVIGVESITGGMVMASYIAFITSLCKGKYRATQYACFSSMMGISRSIFPSISGIIVSNFGWNNFFIFVTLLTIPALIMTIYIKKYILHKIR